MPKFRSWNEELVKFYYWQDGKYYSDKECNNSIVDNKSFTKNIPLFNWQNAEMFTGKRDNDCTEIYEKDYLSTDNPRGIEDVIYLVEWDEWSNSFVITNGDFIEHQLMDIEDNCNIRSNIHEGKK